MVVTLVDGLHLDRSDADTKGDLFEHVLKQIKQAGELGQFRTPRHIIRAIVEIIDPKIGETIYDPAAGTAGFLVLATGSALQLAICSAVGTSGSLAAHARDQENQGNDGQSVLDHPN